MVCVMDAGPLHAPACRGRSRRRSPPRVRRGAGLPGRVRIIPALVAAEVSDLVGRRRGPDAAASFLQALEDFEVEAPLPNEWLRWPDSIRTCP